MPFDSVSLFVIAVLFSSTLIQATFGFGNALTAMPLLSIFVGIREATPLVALMSTTTAAFVLCYDWRNLRLGQARWMFVCSLLGIPVGLFWLTQVDEAIVKLFLAVLIISFVSFCFWSPDRQILKSDRSSWFFGFCGGLLGGAYNTYGPPIVVFGTLRNWNADHFRANLQAFFLPTGCCILAGHAATGLWTANVLWQYAFSLPAAVIAVWIGWAIKRRFSPRQFIRIVYCLLIGLGLSLLWFSVRELFLYSS